MYIANVMCAIFHYSIINNKNYKKTAQFPVHNKFTSLLYIKSIRILQFLTVELENRRA